MDFALARLARRAHSRAEIAAKMERAGYPAAEITETLAKLESWRYLDDEAFARGFARSTAERRHWGPVRIARALKDRGLSNRDVETAVGEAFPEGEGRVLEQALDRFRRNVRRRGSAEQHKARAYRHLLARGFSPQAIWEVLKNLKCIEENETP